MTFTVTTELATITVAAGTADAQAGTEVDVTGEGFQPGEEVTIESHSSPLLLATVNADASGVVAARVLIPTAAEPGAHHLVLTGATGATGRVPLDVSAAAQLAATGATPQALLLLAWTLVASGGALMWVRRRAS